MLGSFCRKFFPVLNLETCVGYSNTHLSFFQYNPVKSLCFIGQSLSTSAGEAEQSFTVSYLMNSCGLSLVNAISASNKVHFETSKKADSVLTLFKNHGFTSAHISKLVMKRPMLLLANPQKTLLPKIQFFSSIGVPSSAIVMILSSDPTLLWCSLENRIIPSYNFLKSIVGSDEKVVKAFSRSTFFFRSNVRKNIGPNLAVLREHGVPQSSIALLVMHFPRVAFLQHKRFIEIVEALERMGFDPGKSMFVQAIKVMSQIGKATLEQKFKVYSKWGWSKDEALSAFICFPHCMVLSDNRIARGMDFLVNKMVWPSEAIARSPMVLCYSFEKRLIPRCLVIQVLLSKSLVKKDLSIFTFIAPKEKYFLERYVTRFQENVPKLMDLYEGKLDSRDVDIGSEETHAMKHL